MPQLKHDVPLYSTFLRWIVICPKQYDVVRCKSINNWAYPVKPFILYCRALWQKFQPKAAYVWSATKTFHNFFVTKTADSYSRRHFFARRAISRNPSSSSHSKKKVNYFFALRIVLSVPACLSIAEEWKHFEQERDMVAHTDCMAKTFSIFCLTSLHFFATHTHTIISKFHFFFLYVFPISFTSSRVLANSAE